MSRHTHTRHWRGTTSRSPHAGGHHTPCGHEHPVRRHRGPRRSSLPRHAKNTHTAYASGTPRSAGHAAEICSTQASSATSDGRHHVAESCPAADSRTSPRGTASTPTRPALWPTAHGYADTARRAHAAAMCARLPHAARRSGPATQTTLGRLAAQHTCTWPTTWRHRCLAPTSSCAARDVALKRGAPQETVIAAHGSARHPSSPQARHDIYQIIHSAERRSQGDRSDAFQLRIPRSSGAHSCGTL